MLYVALLFNCNLVMNGSKPVVPYDEFNLCVILVLYAKITFKPSKHF